MFAPDLYELRARFDDEKILLCFNGPISRSLIEEIGNALRNYLKSEQASPAAALDVFAVYIELTQNIRHYAAQSPIGGAETATVVVSFKNDHYHISAGNLVRLEDGEALVAKIEALSSLDKAELKKVYKEQLRKPRDENAISGAGLGLIDMARKATAPMAASVKAIDETKAYFSVSVQI
ncbi:biofilm regulation protein kinase SiaB [Rhodanobacter aciditrophus]|uniref:Biofilm regulation protein kinase SiaB n=1 Tax=Rhodanobacter aciditrophus TaxID=1623218 RepID=A0ABW4B087_9GAMM